MFLPAALSLDAVHLLSAPSGLVVRSTSPNTAAAVATSSVLVIPSLLGCGFGSNLWTLPLMRISWSSLRVFGIPFRTGLKVIVRSVPRGFHDASCRRVG